MDVEIPANTTAAVFVPANDVNRIKESGRSLSSITDLKIIGTEDGYVKLELGSGSYHFTILK